MDGLRDTAHMGSAHKEWWGESCQGDTEGRESALKLGSSYADIHLNCDHAWRLSPSSIECQVFT